MALTPATAAASIATTEIFILDSAVGLGGHNGWWWVCVLAVADSCRLSGSEVVLAQMGFLLCVVMEEIKLVVWRTCSRTPGIVVKVIILNAAGTFLSFILVASFCPPLV